MIARLWRGAVRRADGDRYSEYVAQTGLAAYRQTPGNQGAWLLRRDIGETTEIVTLSMWESEDAIRGFAGDDIARAVFYPEDDAFLVERDDTVVHYAVQDSAQPLVQLAGEEGFEPSIS